MDPPASITQPQQTSAQRQDCDIRGRTAARPAPHSKCDSEDGNHSEVRVRRRTHLVTDLVAVRNELFVGSRGIMPATCR